jgi:hypothetical protein
MPAKGIRLAQWCLARFFHQTGNFNYSLEKLHEMFGLVRGVTRQAGIMPIRPRGTVAFVREAIWQMAFHLNWIQFPFEAFLQIREGVYYGAA